MDLKDLVLPYVNSKSLDDKGIKLDTALVWVDDTPYGGLRYVRERGKNEPWNAYIFSAPTYTELLLELGEKGMELRMVALAHALEALHEEAAQNADRH
jgi:hypothetical protein